MVAWLDDLLSLTLSNGSEADVFVGLVSVAQKLGFDYCAYGLQMPLPVSKPKVFLLNNYPDSWRNQYLIQDYILIDPTVRHGFASTQPLIWSASDQVRQDDFWADADSHGITYGWCQSSFSRNGIGGLLTLSRSHDRITALELSQNELQYRWLVNVAHEAMSQRQLNNSIFGTSAKLTAREIEILKWSADGKSAHQIAEILGLSKNTVEFHIKNAGNKLQVSNKTAAVVKALILGWL